MQGYPLNVSIPHTENVKNAFSFSFTNYIIEVDDCGKIYSRAQRFKSFTWLHRELRRQALACTLPELPPKKVLGNLDETFVERRRSMLEEYLKALLRLPAVVLDDTIWTFLDADLATVAVPRFLCLPRTQKVIADCLAQLEKVAARDCHLFRFNNTVVLTAIVSFIRKEAQEEEQLIASLPTSQAGPNAAMQQVQQVFQARLANHKCICNVLSPLIANDSTRRGLIEHGIFAVLIEVLLQATSDMVLKFRPTDGYQHMCTSVIDCLQFLLERSMGGALFHFCQKENGLDSLRHLAQGDESLQRICATLLWYGLQDENLVLALVPELTLFGSLLKSESLCARLLAALCVAVFVRHEGALEPSHTEFVLEAIEALPAQLDAAETDAIQRTAQSALDAADPFAELSADLMAALTGASPTSPVRHAANLAHFPPVDRDRHLVRLLENLFSKQNIHRLHALLPSPSGIDAITVLLVVLIDLFVEQFVDESIILAELSGFVPQLRLLIGEGNNCLAKISTDLHNRIARALVRLVGPKEEETHNPPPLSVLKERANTLEILTRYSASCQEKAHNDLERAQGQWRMQEDLVAKRRVQEALCISEARIHEFANEAEKLKGIRSSLGQELSQSCQGVETMLSGIQARGVSRGILSRNIEDLNSKINEHNDLERASVEAREVLVQCEAVCKEASARLDAKATQKRNSESYVRDKEKLQQLAESKATDLQRIENELCSISYNAPASLQRARTSIRSSEQRMAELTVTSTTLAEDAEQLKRCMSKLTAKSGEAEAALNNVQNVMSELGLFKETLESELILTDAEIGKLRDFEFQLQPSRPARLRHVTAENSINYPGIGDENDTPTWEDIPAEQEFRSNPHYRSFSKLCMERKKLWEAELTWIRKTSSALELKVEECAEQRLAQEKEEMQVRQELITLRDEERTMADLEGHAIRHAEARRVSAEAHAEHQRSMTNTVEAMGEMQMIRAEFEQIEREVHDANASVESARAAAHMEESKTVKQRAELQARTADIEGSTRAYLQEWRSMELEELRISFLQERVRASLRSEAETRRSLREEARRLIKELHSLDQQLDLIAETAEEVDRSTAEEGFAGGDHYDGNN